MPCPDSGTDSESFEEIERGPPYLGTQLETHSYISQPAGRHLHGKYIKPRESPMIWTPMKYLAFVAGVAVFALGAVHSVSDLQAAQVETTASDIEYRWARSSGPNGERDRAALPLYEAIFAEDPQKVALLLKHGASPNASLYPRAWSPLMLAIAFYNSEIIRLLVKSGANLNYVSNDPGMPTPLALALSQGLYHPVEHPDFAVFHYLLDSGADMNVEFRNQDIAIFAATIGQMAVVNDLLARGYRHDLPELKRTLEIRIVDEKTQHEKDKALATVNRLLASPRNR